MANFESSPSLTNSSSRTTSPVFPQTPQDLSYSFAARTESRLSKYDKNATSFDLARRGSTQSLREDWTAYKSPRYDPASISTPDDLTAAIDKILNNNKASPQTRTRTHSTQSSITSRLYDIPIQSSTPSPPVSPKSRESRYTAWRSDLTDATLSRSSSASSYDEGRRVMDRSATALRERTNDAMTYSTSRASARPVSRQYDLGHLNSKHGLDRLSEHYDMESPESSTPASALHKAPSSQALPHTYALSSPEIGAIMEKHIPGSLSGSIETHRQFLLASHPLPSQTLNEHTGGRGATGRVVLARKPTMSSSGLVLPSNSIRAMDISRHHIAAFEYLSHVAEAQAWLDRELQRDPDYDASAPEANLTNSGVVHFEQALRNGVALAKLARIFDGRSAVPRIYTASKLAYAHTDNINYFFQFCRRRGLPETYLFETTDLYNARNIPKVIYCIHALNLFLASKGQTQRIKPVENLNFSEDQLDATKGKIDGLMMPNFKSLGRDVAEVLDVAPIESEEERQARLFEEACLRLDPLMPFIQGFMARSRLRRQLSQIRQSHSFATKLQTVLHGHLARRKFQSLQYALCSRAVSPISLQARVRGMLSRRRIDNQYRANRLQACRMIPLQARVRGLLARRRFWKPIKALDKHEDGITRVQAQVKGLLARRKHREKSKALINFSSAVPRFQAMARRHLAEQTLLSRIQTYKQQTSFLIKVQTAARGALARRSHRDQSSNMHRPKAVESVSNFQSLARALLTKRRLHSQNKELEYRQADVVGFQAVARRVIATRYHRAWVGHIKNNEHILIFLQCWWRGSLSRQSFGQTLSHYHEHMEKVVKVQSVFRRRQQAQQYNELTRGRNVPIGTVKNFLHLLQDSDYDYAEELEVEHLRKNVIQAIRDNQVVETEVHELDTKIALLVRNKMSLDEVLHLKRIGTLPRSAAQQAVLAANNDPFSNKSLDRSTQRRLDLYQEMFYLLQTDAGYLARLFRAVSGSKTQEKTRKEVERVAMSLFGYAQQSREEYLLLKLIQRSLHEEIMAIPRLKDFVTTDFLFLKLTMAYGRSGKAAKYLKEVLSAPVCRIAKEDEIDLEVDPLVVYKRILADEEASTGLVSKKPRDLDARQVLGDPVVLKVIISRLTRTRAFAADFFSEITRLTHKMPFGIRWLAREMYRALRATFRLDTQEACVRAVAKFIQYRYLNPAIVAPDNFGIIDQVLSGSQRQALAAISQLLNQIAIGALFDKNEQATLSSLNEYISKTETVYQDWIMHLIDVPDAEDTLHADIFSEHTSQQPVIYISPNEIYLVHALLMEHSAQVLPSDSDRMYQILAALGSPPPFHTDELNRARQGEVELRLVPRVDASPSDSSHLDALWTHTKRLVLLILKVQPGDNLRNALEIPVTREQENIWQQTCNSETKAQKRISRAASIRIDEVYRTSFHELKEQALRNLWELQRSGRLGEDENFQEMLNAIARDIRQKHRKRMQRHAELSSMQHTLSELEGKRKYLDAKLQSYHEYVQQTQATMHKKGKKRLTMPFTTQFFHERSLAKRGIQPKFGSYVYSAAKLHEDGVLLSIDQMSVSRFDQIKIIISCDQVGTFDVEIQYGGVKVSSAKLQYGDLLDAQYNGQTTYVIEDMAQMDINLFLYLLHKRFFN